jgi:hypothetical protein
MTPHSMHGQRLPRGTDDVTDTALSTAAVNVLGFNVMLHMVPSQ